MTYENREVRDVTCESCGVSYTDHQYEPDEQTNNCLMCGQAIEREEVAQ